MGRTISLFADYHGTENSVTNFVAFIRKYRLDEIKQNGLQVFLLSELREVNFKKDTKGGLFGSKKYFMINDATSTDSCAQLIREKKWSNFEPK